MTGVAVSTDALNFLNAMLAAPHCGVVRDTDDQIIHGVDSEGISLTDGDSVAACGAHPVGLIPVGPDGRQTTWPWPPRVADCRRLGLTRCGDCAARLGTANPSTLEAAS